MKVQEVQGMYSVNNKKLRCTKVSVLQPHKAYLGDYFHSNFIQGFKHF